MFGGSVIVDEVHLKMKGKQFCNFTVHYMLIPHEIGLGEPNVRIHNVTLMFVEGPVFPILKSFVLYSML